MDYLDAVLPLVGSFRWLHFALGLLALASLAWAFSRPWVECFTVERAACLRDGRSAWLVFRHGEGGGSPELVSCSLGGKGRRLACADECSARREVLGVEPEEAPGPA